MKRQNTSNKGTASNSLSWAFMIAGLVTLPFYLYKEDLIFWTAGLFVSVLCASFFLIHKMEKGQGIRAN